MTKCVTEMVAANSQVELEYLAYDKEDASNPIGIKVQVLDTLNHPHEAFSTGGES